MNIVIDTNIFISALLKQSLTRKLLIKSSHNFLFPEFEFQELYKYKQEIMQKAGYSEIEFIKMISTLLKYMQIISIENIRDYYTQAYNIIKNIDEEDIIFIATALAYNAAIWSDDKHFKQQDTIRIFTTHDFLEFCKENNNF